MAINGRCFPCASTHPECISSGFLASTHRGQEKVRGTWYSGGRGVGAWALEESVGKRRKEIVSNVFGTYALIGDTVNK